MMKSKLPRKLKKEYKKFKRIGNDGAICFVSLSERTRYTDKVVSIIINEMRGQRNDQ